MRSIVRWPGVHPKAASEEHKAVLKLSLRLVARRLGVRRNVASEQLEVVHAFDRSTAWCTTEVSS